MSAAGDLSAAAQHRTTTTLINRGSRVPFTDSFPVCQAIRAPRQCQRRAICPQQPNIERRRCWSIVEAGFLSLIPSPYAKRSEKGGSALDAPRFAGRKNGRWSSSPRHGAFSNRSCAHRFAPKWSALTAPRQHTRLLAFPSNTVLRAMQRSDPWKLNERRMRIRCMKHGRDRLRKSARTQWARMPLILKRDLKLLGGFIGNGEPPCVRACVSGVEKRPFSQFFLGFGVSFAEEKPFVTNNASFQQETRVWAAKTKQTVRWLLSVCAYQFDFAPRRQPRAQSM